MTNVPADKVADAIDTSASYRIGSVKSNYSWMTNIGIVFTVFTYLFIERTVHPDLYVPYFVFVALFAGVGVLFMVRCFKYLASVIVYAQRVRE